MYEQKDIVLIQFPYTDFSLAKKRPALILSNMSLNKIQDVICCLVTTKPRDNDLLIEKRSFESGKLPFKSFIRPYRIFTINKHIIYKKLGKINNNLYDKVISKLNEFIKR